MNRRWLLIVPGAMATMLVPAGLAAAVGGGIMPGAPGANLPAPAIPRPGDPSPVGWGSTYQAPMPGSGIDTNKLVPGLTVRYGAATDGLFASPPTDPSSGYVAESPSAQRPSRGEIDSFLAADGHVYYRVVNRSSAGVTYSH